MFDRTSFKSGCDHDILVDASMMVRKCQTHLVKPHSLLVK